MPDQGQKSEKPTARRLFKAREEGNFPTARLFVNAIQFLAFVSLLHTWGPEWFQRFQTSFDGLLQHALNPRTNPMDIAYMGAALMQRSMIPVALLGCSLIAVTLSIQVVVTGFGISLKKLAPDLKRLDPLAKLRQLPRQNGPALLQAAVMLPVFAVVIYYLAAGDLASYVTLPLQGIRSATNRVFGFIEALLWKATLLFVVFGAVDLLRQKSRYQRDLRMSKQEIRDEAKETDGNPLIKQRIRRLRRDFARRTMMREVKTATALIVNPTHYAVALKYDMETRGAPKVVAKGKNYLAARIRQKAMENQVPLIENPPLAQGLYKHVDVGQEIPAHFYKAVAEVLAYIFRVMNGRRTA